MVIFLFAIPFVGVLVSLIIWFAHHQQRTSNDKMRRLGDQLGAHVVENGVWATPRLVLDHKGLRSRIRIESSIQQPHPSRFYPTMSSTKLLMVVTDGFPPGLDLQIGPMSFASKLASWFQGRQCVVNDPVFDQDFVISASQFHDSIDRIISPEIVACINELNQFALPSSPVQKTPAASPPTKPLATALSANQMSFDASVNLLNRKRFYLTLAGGECQCHMLIHESEEENLDSVIRSILNIQSQLADQIVSVGKESGKAAAV